MYDNISGKIKGLAKFVCWAGIILCVIAGIIMIVSGIQMKNNYRRSYDDQGTTMIIYGFSVLIGGSIGSWLSSLLVYGFGELIEKSVSIDGKLTGMGSKTMVLEKDDAGRDVARSYSSADSWSCPKCKALNPNSKIECRECGTIRN